MNAPMTMLSRVEAYLIERRSLGFVPSASGHLILSFARFADAIGHDGPLNPDIVLRWAKEEATRSNPFTWANRVNVLRPFACWLGKIEPETVFPHGKPFGHSYRRLAPHIYTMAEITELLEAAETIPQGFGAGAKTMPTLLGLLAATGLRISEALGLQHKDWDKAASHLTIRHSKFKRSRIVPLHPSTSKALRRYVAKQSQFCQKRSASTLFINERDGNTLHYRRVRNAWIYLLTQTGIVPRGGHPFIRIHDLRHTFICRRLMLWQEQGVEIDNAMLALSTYVGHAEPSST